MRSSAEISILISLAWLRLRRYVLDCGPPMHVHMHACINRSETSCVASAASSRGSRYSGCVWLLQPDRGLPRRSTRVIRVPVTPLPFIFPATPPQLIVSPSLAPHTPHCASFYARCRTRSSLSLHVFLLTSTDSLSSHPLPPPPISPSPPPQPPLPSEASARPCGHLLPPAFSFSTGEALREARWLIQGDRRHTTPSHKSTCCYCCCCCCGTQTLTPARASDILCVPASDRALPAT